MASDDFKPSSEPKKYIVDAETERTRMAISAGTVGRFFGVGMNASRNIAGLVALLLLLFLIVFTVVAFWSSGAAAVENILKIWAIAMPLLTGVVGYLFGSAANSTPETD
jgi:hypothetical protein